MYWRQYQQAGVGGLDLGFTDGTQTAWLSYDTAGQPTQGMTTQNQWVNRAFDLTPSLKRQCRLCPLYRYGDTAGDMEHLLLGYRDRQHGWYRHPHLRSTARTDTRAPLQCQ